MPIGDGRKNSGGRLGDGDPPSGDFYRFLRSGHVLRSLLREFLEEKGLPVPAGAGDGGGSAMSAAAWQILGSTGTRPVASRFHATKSTGHERRVLARPCCPDDTRG